MNELNSSNKAKPAITVNIDTVEFTLEGMHFDIPGATVVTVKSPNCETLNSYGNRVPIKGKFGAHMIQVRTMNSGTELFFEGSPFAFRYGQNVFTSNNLLEGCSFVIKCGVKKFGIKPPDNLSRQWGMGNFNLKRIDLAVNFQLESESEVLNVIKQIGRQLHESGSSMQSCNSTVYFRPRMGKDYSICFYAKEAQMRQAQRYAEFPNAGRLVNECENTVRVELRLHASELRTLGLEKVSAWKSDTAAKVFRKYWAKVRFLNVTSGPITDSDFEGMPKGIRAVIALHKSGVDITRIYSKRTCQRYRKIFRELGIDLRCPNQPLESITSLDKYLSPKKVIKGAPAWMKEKGLVPPSADDGDVKQKQKGFSFKKTPEMPTSKVGRHSGLDPRER